MKCSYCGFSDTQVKDSRPADDGSFIKRRRLCPDCGGRFTTFERLEAREIKVLKLSGEQKPFNSGKLLKSLELATRKRPIDYDQLENIVSHIIQKLEKYGEGEVSTRIIGELAMNELAKLDQVAFVRYASVYKDFNQASDFSKFIREIKENYNG